jgi:UDP-GlcNAc:undecaprenyl-phosphate GlcNAc-1-phosphate transferase
MHSEFNSLLYVAPFACAALLSWWLTRTVRDVARRRGWSCRPVNHRDIHLIPIPRLGGVAIFATLVSTVLLYHFVIPDPYLTSSKLEALIGAGALIFFVGLWDDLRGVTVAQKFAAEIAAAAVLFFVGGFKILKLPLLFGSHHFSIAVAFLLTASWIILVTNAFNLIDGLDGLASGSALFSLAVLFVASLQTLHYSVSYLAIILVGATLGFLRYNFSPASIFLGDSGALLLGFMVSALALVGAEKSVVAVVIPLVSFALPLLDTTIAVLRRFLSGRPLFSPDREHIHHKLLEKGLSQRGTAVVLYCVSAVFGLISLSLLHPTGSSVAISGLVCALMLAIGIHRLGYYEFAELGLAARRILAEKRTIARNVALRHAVDDLGRASTMAGICRALSDACACSAFERLQVTVESEQPLTAEGALAYLGGPGGISLVCTPTGPLATGVAASNDAQPSWTLTFPLGNAAVRRATLTAYSSGELTGEVALLTTEFRSALATAIERVLSGHTTPRTVSEPASTHGQQEAAA